MERETPTFGTATLRSDKHIFKAVTICGVKFNKRAKGALLAFVVVCAGFFTASVTKAADTNVATINVGSRPFDVAINPAGTFAYVSNYLDGSVSKINLSTDTVVATIDLGGYLPLDVTINSAGTFAYVTNSFGKVSKINLSTDTVVATIDLQQSWPFDLAINPAGTFAYVVNSGSRSVSKINLSTDTVVATITVGWDPYGIAINPAGTFAYVTSSSGSVYKINLSTDTFVALAVSSFGTRGVTIDSAGTFAYLVHDTAVSKFSLSTDTVVAGIAVGGGAYDLAINPAGTYAYVASNGSVSKINLSTFISVASIGVGSDSRSVAINPAGTFAYVSSNLGDSVSKINMAATEPQSITFASVATTLLGAETVSLSATASSGLLVSFSSATTSVCTVSGSVVTLLTFGECTIHANQSGGSGWDAASQVSRTFTVARQVITFGSLSDVLLGSGTRTVSATASSGLVVSFSSSTSAVCTVSGTTVTLVDYGVCTVKANQSGANNDAALEVSQSFTVARQVITFGSLSDVLLGSGTRTVSATASSGLVVSFSSSTSAVCTVSGTTVTLVKSGDCSIEASQNGTNGDNATSVTQSFFIAPSPPSGEAGISINDGMSYSNMKAVSISMVWPAYAKAVRISNDGGFAPGKTSTFLLAPTIEWTLDDSIKGIYTKVVYVRFSGVGIDTTKTYSDDIILDTNPPVIESSSAAAVSGSIDLTLKATDDITGVDKVEIVNGTTTVTKDYATKVSVPLADLLLSVSSMGVQKLAATSIKVRVSDSAGNWSAYKALSVSGVVATPTVNTPTATTPTVNKSKSATAKSIAIFAKIPVLSTSKVSLKVVSGYAKFCKVSGTTLKGLKTGACKVTVTVTPKKGRATTKTVTLKVAG